MKFSKLSLAALVAFAMVSGSLLADDTFEYKGYARVGKAWTNGMQSVDNGFGLIQQGDPLKWNGRLGQELDQCYVENSFVKNFQTEGGAWAKFNVLFTLEGELGGDSNDYLSGTTLQDYDGGDSLVNDWEVQGSDASIVRSRVRQAYVEMGGLGFAPDMTFWVGKRYLNRQDVHILDYYYLDASGSGFGVTNIASIGLDLAFIGWEISKPESQKAAEQSPEEVKDEGHRTKNSLVAKWENKMLRLDYVYSTVSDNGKSGTDKRGGFDGHFVTATFKPEKFFYALPGSSAVVFQYANNANAEHAWWANRVTNGTPHFGDLDTEDKIDGSYTYTAMVHGVAQVSDSLAIVPVFGYAQSVFTKYRSGGKSKTDKLHEIEMSRMFGAVRVHYAVLNNLAAELELGYYGVSSSIAAYNAGLDGSNVASWSGIADGEKESYEMKITPAVVLTMDQGFWTRPQIRFFYEIEQVDSEKGKTIAGTWEKEDMAQYWGVQAEAWW